MNDKKFVKTNKTDKVISGVVGGIAKATGLNVTFLRFVSVFLLFSFSFLTFLAYIILAIWMKEE